MIPWSRHHQSLCYSFLAQIEWSSEHENSVQTSTEFAREMSNMKIDDDETMVSFNVVSLFTAIPPIYRYSCLDR